MSLRDDSRKEYPRGSSVISRDEVQIGCLQRIADATELMAKNHDSLIADRDYYKRRYMERGEEIDHLERRIRSLKGVITKLKK